jgi:hypothetical protein
MFEKMIDAEARILADEGSGNVMNTDFHGVHWYHHTYILEVHPPAGEKFRVEAKAKVALGHTPQPGDTVRVSFSPKNQKTEIHIEGDPRYDPKLARAAGQQQREDERQALLNGAPAPAAAGVVHGIIDDGPQWIVPEVCPECGARVDQSVASVAEHPACEFCKNPLPSQPVPEDY